MNRIDYKKIINRLNKQLCATCNKWWYFELIEYYSTENIIVINLKCENNEFRVYHNILDEYVVDEESLEQLICQQVESYFSEFKNVYENVNRIVGCLNEMYRIGGRYE